MNGEKAKYKSQNQLERLPAINQQKMKFQRLHSLVVEDNPKNNYDMMIVKSCGSTSKSAPRSKTPEPSVQGGPYKKQEWIQMSH